MIDNSKLFRLREEHIRYIYKITNNKLQELYKKYGADFKSILRDDSYESKEDSEEYQIINYIHQRAKLLIAEYDSIKQEKAQNLI